MGNRHPHELPGLHVTITDMLVLHRALLEWRIVGTPSALWQLGCLHPDIHPPVSARTGPYPLLSSTAITSLTKGHPWRPERSIYVGPSSTTAWPSPANAGPHDPHPTEFSSSAPTGHLSGPQPLTDTQSPTPQIPGPAPSEADPSSPSIWTDEHLPLLRAPLPIRRRRQSQPRQLTPHLNGVSSIAPSCPMEPSASFLLGPNDGILTVDASTPRKNNPCS